MFLLHLTAASHAVTQFTKEWTFESYQKKSFKSFSQCCDVLFLNLGIPMWYRQSSSYANCKRRIYCNGIQRQTIFSLVQCAYSIFQNDFLGRTQFKQHRVIKWIQCTIISENAGFFHSDLQHTLTAAQLTFEVLSKITSCFPKSSARHNQTCDALDPLFLYLPCSCLL